ncbi:hypothetical protein [Shewanella decolorationis]|uniref:Uncharacterized protein n=1 Tax=Shewanella decolorationis S12 TaxID=1353536 RepID=A0ABP2YZ63_9GAMM|nr:hypothetical protein [Shewanella decolorationis]ESE39629.1 hypothetical protein SHD_3838 [Shewanella decolorationis S12]GLR32844.1 hypothetical protein GCM10007922_24030 [Shewanella decolorationis]
MSSAATVPSTATPTKQQVLLKGLESTGEQSFARVVGANYGFRISNRWEKTAVNIDEDIKSTNSKYQNCTVDNLENLVDRVIISANHHYTIYKVSQKDAIQIRQELSALVGQPVNNIFAQTYPALVDFNSVNPAAGEYLCKVADMGDGIACIFASIVKESLPGYRTMTAGVITSQYFHTVFVPYAADRIEVRITDNAPTRYHEKHATAIKIEFQNIIGQKGVHYPTTQVNFFKCIESYFNDPTSGRIAHAILTTGQDSKDAELKSLRSKDYCARTQQVVDKKNNFNYVCRAILLRKPYTGISTGEMDISFFPHKNTWEANFCWCVQVKKPQTSAALNLIITDAIARS